MHETIAVVWNISEDRSPAHASFRFVIAWHYRFALSQYLDTKTAQSHGSTPQVGRAAEPALAALLPLHV